MGRKISVIMGLYNCERTLDEAVKSILQQTYKDFEIIMCDDGSGDGTYAVANRISNCNPDITLIRNEKNMGLNYTLNHCLQYAEGEYIARMDADDISLPERFEKQVDFLDNHSEYAVVSTPMIYFDENGVFGEETFAGGEPDINSFPLGTPFCHAPAMIRREALETVQGYTVDDKYLRVEDWQLWVKMYAAGYKGYNLSEALYKMRDDRAAVSRRKFKYRLNEARVSAYSVKALRLPSRMYICACRPILVGLLPKKTYEYLHRRKLHHD